MEFSDAPPGDVLHNSHLSRHRHHNTVLYHVCILHFNVFWGPEYKLLFGGQNKSYSTYVLYIRTVHMRLQVTRQTGMIV